MVPYGEAGDCYSLANCPQGEGPRLKSCFTLFMFRKVQHQPDGDRSQGGGSLQLDRGGQQALSVAAKDSGDKLTWKLIKLILIISG